MSKTDSENALDALEAPARRAKHAVHNLDSLRNAPAHDHPKMKAAHAEALSDAQADLSTAQSALAAHEAAHGGSVKLHRKIDAAAQAVLDERGEKHTDQPAGK